MTKSKRKFPAQIIFIVIIIIWFFLIDYSDFFSQKNLGAFFGIFASVAFIVAIRFQDKQSKKEE
jgi:hypothetical protein